MQFSVRQDLLKFIDQAGDMNDQDIHLTDAALALGALESDGLSIERYQNHIQKLVREVGTRHEDLIEEGADDDVLCQLATLKYIIHDKHDYRGDSETYDDIQNANLVRVIERRKGMPIALSILYIHVALEQGWNIAALNFPAHVVCRLEKQGQIILFDPFNECKILQAADLRKLLKELVSPTAELDNQYYDLATKRDLLIRLQNNIKLRQIEVEDYLGAIKTIKTMRRLDPAEYRLLLDLGVLYARTNQALAAVEALEKYIDRTPSKADQEEALILLQQIRQSLN